MPFLLLWIWICLGLLGCAKHAETSYDADGSYAAGGSYPAEEMEASDESYRQDFAVATSAAPKRAAPRAEGRSAGASPAAPAPPPPPPPPGQAAAPEPEAAPLKARMVHYNGQITTRVDRPAEVAEELRRRAEAQGGYVEQQAARSITLRIPVERFDAFFEELLGVGQVIRKSISADDVTDAFEDMELRLKAARSTHARLVALLARAETEEEKIGLLREIQRVSEEIDRLQSSVRTLATLARYSRITVTLEERPSLGGNPQEAAPLELAWIRGLSPTAREALGRRLALEVPEGLVELNQKGRFIAESADGVVLWTQVRDNLPRGGVDYWAAAIHSRIAADFAQAEQRQVGDWTVLRMVDRAEQPYIWWIALRVEGGRLQLAQVYFPSPAHEGRHQVAIERSLKGGGQG